MLKLLRKNKRAKAKEVYTEFYKRILDYKNREEQERREARSQVGSAVPPFSQLLDQSMISVTVW